MGMIQPRPAAIAILPHQGKVLLVRRANPPDPGRWGFPGGKIEPGETYMDAAIRELAEETTIRAEALRAIDALDVIVREPDGALKFHYVLVAVLCRFIDGTPKAGDDVNDADWFAPAEIAADPQIFLDRVAGLAVRALNPALA